MSEFSLHLPDATVNALIERITARVRKELERTEPYMTPDEAGTYMGGDRRRIYDLIAAKKLPSYRDGRKVLVRRSDIDTYLRGQ